MLEICQDVAETLGIKVPTLVVGSSDKQIRQLFRLLNKVVDDLSITRRNWTIQTREALHTSVNAELQGTIESIAPGAMWLNHDTFYDRTENLQITGPLSPQQWQLAHSVPYTSAYHSFRLWQGNFYLYPLIEAGHTIAFEYKSVYLVYDTVASSYKRYFSLDTDTFGIDDTLLMHGLIWKWRQRKGLSYAEDFKTYERLVKDLSANDATAATISMDGGSSDRLPGIFVPGSDWNVT